MKKTKIGFVGLGLIGGSIAKAVRLHHPDYELVGFDKNEESLSLAVKEKVLNASTNQIDHNFMDCDFIFLCAPVSFNSAYLTQLKSYINKDCILTDAGSVKNGIHKEIEEVGLSSNFIGGHPMTGSEKSGYKNSKALLLENSYYILTPTQNISKVMIDRYKELIESIKALPFVMDYQTHDFVTGGMSHLPHVVAASLVLYMKEHDTDNHLMKQLAAGGFKDITRIASSSPIMWEHICLENKDNIIQILDDYMSILKDFKQEIKRGEGEKIHALFDSSRNFRNSISDFGSGALKKVYGLYCDLKDETGGIATIASALAKENISIRNIGIIHNREFEDGVLKIEFYKSEDLQRAKGILRREKYIVYER
ncbi:prephenate dehydrogenase [Aequitasia blattaphilus]|uniref:Prephenate dehydrogenase n=1 Tax=Aequitasia blattaphilus TaxID=2949332 RepID=A0ABT1E6Y3_9FIRM|nr:prephenate dehydrogenase [Aequitasia blattaphilus]MCP1101471.1 prephenate dehydrogenase [Aequitasia blattaphilus]MCR8614111.1 prephenate dehydrogenase [Aequitasia blattaphilus]